MADRQPIDGGFAVDTEERPTPDHLFESGQVLSEDELVDALSPFEPTPAYKPPTSPIQPKVIGYVRRTRRGTSAAGAITLVEVFFFLGTAACVVIGLRQLVADLSIPSRAWYEQGTGIFIGLLGPVFLRIVCEVIITFFRTYERLRDLLDALEIRAEQDSEFGPDGLPLDPFKEG